MAKLNIEPMMTFQDGSFLLISTKYNGDATFKCELYVSRQYDENKMDVRMVSPYSIEAATCREAQEKAYAHALRLYPHATTGMKRPPYLIWHGPAVSMER